MSSSFSDLSCLVVGATDPKSIGYTCAAGLQNARARVCIMGRDGKKVRTAVDKLNGEHGVVPAVIAEAIANTAAIFALQDARSANGSARPTEAAQRAIAVEGIVGDLKKPETMASLLDHAVSLLGGTLDVLIISVGNGKSEYLGLDPKNAEDYKMSYDVAVLSPQFLIDAAAPYLMKSTQKGGGSVVVVGTMAPMVPWPDTAPYNYARAAQNCMVETMAFRHRLDNIRVNAVLPSCIHTGALDLMAAKKGKTAEEYAKLRAEAQPTGRNGKPEEVADAALFLAGSGASYMTGELMKVDGGLHLSSWFNRPKITKEFVGGTD
eukprot:CAMPEP_0178571188 /NCGR_PEP_ID=MMETSP0697-20121206/17492_1 /TAXON_ID=265572 /ORGANISM="Extubocellulus spinifer, Strain CCMP396" /LENGTH=320 /DNA_ID=CAMNT_0020205705 /DNA_START=52 /DNA_END=1014 /DNA_ORIENTATION=+